MSRCTNTNFAVIMCVCVGWPRLDLYMVRYYRSVCHDTYFTASCVWVGPPGTTQHMKSHYRLFLMTVACMHLIADLHTRG